MREALATASVVPFVFALAVVAFTLGRLPLARAGVARELAAGIALALEFLLAAGLLRLSALRDAQAIAAVAAIVAIRKLISYGIGLALRATRASSTRADAVSGRTVAAQAPGDSG